MQTKIKGAVLRARTAFVQKHFGGEAWGRVLAALPEADRYLVDGGTVEVGWYPFDLGDRLDHAIVDIVGKGEPEVLERIGAQSARENLTTVHRDFLKPGNPQAFMARAPMIYRFYYDTGRRTYEPTGPTSGLLTTFDADTFSRTDCLTVIGWYREALAMCGARDVRVTHETCRARGAETCSYRMDWSMDEGAVRS